MRKKVLTAVAVIVFGGSSLNVYFSKNDNLDVAMSQNIEALASEDFVANNTGPAEIVDCPGWFTGDAKYCMCENVHPCTQILCQ
jgi:hypothetical protein